MTRPRARPGARGNGRAATWCVAVALLLVLATGIAPADAQADPDPSTAPLSRVEPPRDEGLATTTVVAVVGAIVIVLAIAAFEARRHTDVR